MEKEKDILKEYKLEDMAKRFQQIVEYTFITSPTISEDGEDDTNSQNQQEPQDVTQQQDNNNVDNQDAVDNSGDVSIQQGSEEDVPVETEVSDDETMEDMPQQQDNGGIETTPMQDGDEVIDVDDLTNSQKETEYKIDGVDDRLIKIARVIDKLIPAIEANNSKIEDLKAEFEKRNPTESEKLNLRSQSSFPYSVKPKDYWNNKSQDGNYNVIYDNGVDPNKEDKEYVLKQKDIDNAASDDRSTYKTFDIPKQLTDYFDLF